MNRALTIGLLLTGLLAGTIRAAAPELKYLNPAGAQRGSTAEVAIGGSPGTRPVSVWCSRDGVTVSVAEKAAKLSVQIPGDAQPGLCWIRLYNAEGASDLRAFVIGTLPDVADKEPNNHIKQAQQLPSTRVVVNGLLAKSGDVDAFALPLKKGQTVVASVEANRRFGSPMDALLQIVSPRGFVLDQNDDAAGVDPQLAYTADASGTYYVRVFAFPATPNSSIRLAGGSNYVYRLTLTTGPFVDHAVPMSLTRGDNRSVRLKGWNIPEKLQELPLRVDGDAGSVTVQHAELANTLELPVDNYPSVAEHEPNRRQQPETIALPSVLTGRIDPPGDDDSFQFSAKKGERLTFRLDSRVLGYPLDAVLQLYDASGKSLTRVDDSTRGKFDALLNYTVAQDGEFRISVSDLYGHGGLRYVYRLTVGIQRPDFTLSTKADKFVLTAGKPLKIPVTVSRGTGFAAEIEIATEGLPEGITVASVKSVPKSKTEKSVELVLTTDGDVTVERAFRIVGRSRLGSEDLVRTATAPVAGLTQKTSAYWLTVRKADKK